MQTLTIEVLNDKALRLLKDLEQLQLIKVKKKPVRLKKTGNWAEKYMGTMAKEPMADVDAQLAELRNAWQ